LERRVSNLADSCVKFGDYTKVEEIAPLSALLIEGYLDGRFDEVIVFSTHFRSALRQEVLVRRLFPVRLRKFEGRAPKKSYRNTAAFADLLKEKRYPSLTECEELREYLIEPDAAASSSRLPGISSKRSFTSWFSKRTLRNTPPGGWR
jgi:F0F1-type ATP synthase gamma subunit